MTVTLDPQLERRIQREMERGHYREPSEVISHALNLLDAQEDWLLRNRDAIDERLAESMAEAERGEVYSADEAARLLDQRIADRAARRTQ
jgi:putative addiction module CopG family antidote